MQPHYTLTLITHTPPPHPPPNTQRHTQMESVESVLICLSALRKPEAFVEIFINFCTTYSAWKLQYYPVCFSAYTFSVKWLCLCQMFNPFSRKSALNIQIKHMLFHWEADQSLSFRNKEKSMLHRAACSVSACLSFSLSQSLSLSLWLSFCLFLHVAFLSSSLWNTFSLCLSYVIIIVRVIIAVVILLLPYCYQSQIFLMHCEKGSIKSHNSCCTYSHVLSFFLNFFFSMCLFVFHVTHVYLFLFICPFLSLLFCFCLSHFLSLSIYRSPFLSVYIRIFLFFSFFLRFILILYSHSDMIWSITTLMMH